MGPAELLGTEVQPVKKAWQFLLGAEPWIACGVAAVLTVAAYFVTEWPLALGLTILTWILINQYRSFAREQTERDAQVLPDPLVGGRLTDMLRDAAHWRFRGGTGSFLRTSTLPTLAKKSRRDGRRIVVHVELINPANNEACAAYVRYRVAADPYAKSGGREWSARYVQCEIAASIVAATFQAASSQLSVQFAFSNTAYALRYDVSDTQAVITSAYKSFPAMAIRKKCRLFSSIVTDLELSFETAPMHLEIDTTMGKKDVSPGREADFVGAVLRNLPSELALSDFTEDELEAIAVRAGLRETKK